MKEVNEYDRYKFWRKDKELRGLVVKTMILALTLLVLFIISIYLTIKYSGIR